MNDMMEKDYANPSSLHDFGLKVEKGWMKQERL